MRKLLSRVEDVFQIAGRGCVVIPGIPQEADRSVWIGDPVWLERPDGSEISTVICGIDLFGPDNDPWFPILLNGLTRDQIPIGTLLTVDIPPAESTMT